MFHPQMPPPPSIGLPADVGTEGLGLEWGQAGTYTPSIPVLLCIGIPSAGDYEEEVMGSFPFFPRGPILKGSGGTEITTLPISI